MFLALTGYRLKGLDVLYVSLVARGVCQPPMGLIGAPARWLPPPPPPGPFFHAAAARGDCSKACIATHYVRASRLPALEAELCGQIPSADLVQPHHLAPLTPIDDVRASAGYRRHAALELVRRAVAGLA